MPHPPPAHSRDLILDFWRGASITLVIAAHLAYFRFRQPLEWLAEFRLSSNLILRATGIASSSVIAFSRQAGNIGIMIFFIVSGYIITKLLLEEEAVSGTVSIPRFYARRAMKILPPYAAYAAFVGIAVFFGWISRAGPQEACFAFLANTPIANCMWSIVHFWSLSVEEQFYLAWPALFLLIAPARREYAAIGMLILFLALSSFGILVTNGWIDNGRSFAAILAGILYAVSPSFRRLVPRLFPIAAAVALAIFAFVPYPFPPHIAFPYFLSVILFLLGMITVSYRIRRFVPDPPFRAFTALGVVSYSAYLWQQIFMDTPAAYPHASIITNPLLAIPFILASYFLIEQPCARWSRAMFTVPRRARADSI